MENQRQESKIAIADSDRISVVKLDQTILRKTLDGDVQAYAKAEAQLRKFRDVTIDRYSRDSLLGMETLDLSLMVERYGPVPCPLVDDLLDLALERNVGEIKITVGQLNYSVAYINLPVRALFNSSVKKIRLSGVVFPVDLDLRPLTSLRVISLFNVDFDDDQLLTDLIANSPLLEGLVLDRCTALKKLKVSGAAKLELIAIRDCTNIKKVEIVAPGLESFDLIHNYQYMNPGFKIELTAPNLVEFACTGIREGDLEAMISNLPSLKNVILVGYRRDEKKKNKASGSEKAALLDRVFRTCRPESVIVAPGYVCSSGDTDFKLDEYFSLKELQGRYNWGNQLKDVKIGDDRGNFRFTLTWGE